jgi:DnaJ-class molecular chaperone
MTQSATQKVNSCQTGGTTGTMSTSKSQCDNCRGDKCVMRRNDDTLYISKIILKGPRDWMTMSASVDLINPNIDNSDIFVVVCIFQVKVGATRPQIEELPMARYVSPMLSDVEQQL